MGVMDDDFQALADEMAIRREEEARPINSVRRELEAGYHGLTSSSLQAVASVVGPGAFQRAADRQRLRGQISTEKSEFVHDIDKIEGVGDAASFATGAVLNSLPSLALGGVGSMVGRLAVKGAAGAMGGLAVSMYPSHVGETYEGMREQAGEGNENLAAGAGLGALATLADLAGVGHLITHGATRTARKVATETAEDVGRGLPRRMITGAVSTAAEEGAAEGFQQYTSELGRAVVDPKYDPLGPEGWKRIKDSIIAGATVGGVLGGVVGARRDAKAPHGGDEDASAPAPSPVATPTTGMPLPASVTAPGTPSVTPVQNLTTAPMEALFEGVTPTGVTLRDPSSFKMDGQTLVADKEGSVVQQLREANGGIADQYVLKTAALFERTIKLAVSNPDVIPAMTARERQAINDDGQLKSATKAKRLAVLSRLEDISLGYLGRVEALQRADKEINEQIALEDSKKQAAMLVPGMNDPALVAGQQRKLQEQAQAQAHAASVAKNPIVAPKATEPTEENTRPAPTKAQWDKANETVSEWRTRIENDTRARNIERRDVLLTRMLKDETIKNPLAKWQATIKREFGKGVKDPAALDPTPDELQRIKRAVEVRTALDEAPPKVAEKAAFNRAKTEEFIPTPPAETQDTTLGVKEKPAKVTPSVSEGMRRITEGLAKAGAVATPEVVANSATPAEKAPKAPATPRAAKVDLWARAQNGLTYEADGERPTPLLEAAKRVRDKGGLKNESQFEEFRKDYSRIGKGAFAEDARAAVERKHTPKKALREEAKKSREKTSLPALSDAAPAVPGYKQRLTELLNDGVMAGRVNPQEAAEISFLMKANKLGDAQARLMQAAKTAGAVEPMKSEMETPGEIPDVPSLPQVTKPEINSPANDTAALAVDPGSVLPDAKTERIIKLRDELDALHDQDRINDTQLDMFDRMLSDAVSDADFIRYEARLKKAMKPDPNSTPDYSAREAPVLTDIRPSTHMSMEEARGHALELTKDWDNAPTVKLVDIYDPQSPAEEVFADDVIAKHKKGFEVMGRYDRVNGVPTVYVTLQYADSVESLRGTLFHEGLGHYGLKDYFGAQLRPIMERIYRLSPKIRAEIEKLPSTYGAKTARDPRAIARLTEEIMVRNWDTADIQPKWLDWLRVAIRETARKWGWENLSISDAEIRTILLKGREAVVSGAGAASEARGPINTVNAAGSTVNADLEETRYAPGNDPRTLWQAPEEYSTRNPNDVSVAGTIKPREQMRRELAGEVPRPDLKYKRPRKPEHVPRRNAAGQTISPMAPEDRVVESAIARLPVGAQPAGRSIMTNIRDWSKKGQYWMSFGRDLIDMIDNLFPSAARDYSNFIAQREATAYRAKQEIDRVMQEAHKLPFKSQETLNKVALPLTFADGWGYVPTWKTDVKQSASAKALWDGIVLQDPVNGKQIQNVLDQMARQEYQGQVARQEAIKAIAMEDLSGPEFDKLPTMERNRRMKQARARVEVYSADTTTVPGMYLPVSRFGNYAAVVKSAEFDAYQNIPQGDRSEDYNRILDTMRKDPKHYIMDFRDSLGAAEKLKNELLAANPRMTGQAYEREALNQTLQSVPWQSLQQLNALIGDELGGDLSAEHKRRVSDKLKDMYFTTLAEQNVRKHMAQRKKVTGAEINMIRSFVTHGTANATFVASISHNAEIYKALNEMRKIKDAEGQSSRSREDKSRAFNEVIKRHAIGMTTVDTPVQDALMRFTSIWTLLTSPRYYVQNAMQTGMVSVPIMAGRHGYFKTWGETVQAYHDIIKSTKANEWGDFISGKYDLKELKKQLSDKGKPVPFSDTEFDMLQELRDNGLLDIGQSFELGYWESFSQGNTLASKGNQMFQSGLHKLTSATRAVETSNRVSAALAAYRLEKKKGTSEQSARDYAAKIINDTHGDYAGINAPRAFGSLGGVSKLAFQFRKYQLIQFSLLAKQLNTIFRGADPTEKWIAAKSFAFLMTQTSAFTGIMGLPTAAALTYVMAAAFDDKDRPDDWKKGERWLRDAIGDKTLADLILNGAPTLGGLDVQAYLGMENVLSVLPYNDGNLTSREGYANLLMGIGGPMAGIGANFADGMGLMGKDSYWKGLEMMMPSGIKNGMRAYREGTEGITRRNGDLLVSAEEFNFMQNLMKGLGINTARMSEIRRTREDMHDYEEHFKSRTETLKRHYRDAKAEGDAGEMDKLRAEWKHLQDSKKSMGFERAPITGLILAEQQASKRAKTFRKRFEEVRPD